MELFKGTGVALVTPFKQDGQIDFNSLEKLVNYVIDGNVDYLVVMGTTAESPVINFEEKKQVLEVVDKVNNGRKKIVFGVGGNDTQKLLKEIEQVNNFSCVDAILSVTPYYNKPNQRALIAHFSLIAEKSTKPIILYNVPGRTGINMLPETALTLAQKYSNVIAIKEASGNFDQIMFLIENKPKNFEIISGDDGITFPLVCVGACGVISVVANAIPLHFSEMVRLALSGKIEEAKTLHYKTLELTRLAFVEGNPAGIKCALSHLGIIENNLRLPLVPVSDTLNQKIKDWIERNVK